MADAAVAPQDGSQVPAAAEGMPSEVEHWLVCENCGLPLVEQAEVIEEKFVTWNTVVWPYELTVLDRDSWCYSATNPSNARFDIVRVLPSVVGRSIKRRGSPTPEYSWFPGFGWCMAHCQMCGKHLGWTFSPNADSGTGEADANSESQTQAASQDVEEAEDVTDVASSEGQINLSLDAASEANADIAFVGLILTSLREKELKAEEVQRRMQAAEENCVGLMDARSLFQMHFNNRLPASQEAIRSALLGGRQRGIQESLAMLREVIRGRRSADRVARPEGREGEDDANMEDHQSSGSFDSLPTTDSMPTTERGDSDMHPAAVTASTDHYATDEDDI
mmetsp:Transcript_51963/g.121675  ORF Transcript_51963/g.121675 Transcript_51963/m.121675 type:complete len:335 (-) Transcript_51963:71-1075(-)